MDTENICNNSRHFSPSQANLSYNNVKYVIQRQTDALHHLRIQNGLNIIQSKLANAPKEAKLKTELLLEHAINKSQLISPEMFDELDFIPRSPKRKSNLEL
jgi:hypothetical protein